jgi:pre-mRNA-processing factor 6
MVQARKIIEQGCQQCPKNEDVWFHAAELNVSLSGASRCASLVDHSSLQTPENAKIILARAVQQIPQSVKIWLKAAALESDVKAKKRVLRKGDDGRSCEHAS